MTLTKLITRACTLSRPGEPTEKDEYDNDIPGDPETVDTVCELQSRKRDEEGDHGEMSVTDWVAYFLPEEEVTADSTLIVDGIEYELVGDPAHVRNPRTDRFSHIEANVRKAR